jgi:hypothetical protein
MWHSYDSRFTIFAISAGNGVIRGYTCLGTCCEKAGLGKPEKVTSVSLRKYMATVTQVHNRFMSKALKC